MTDPEKVLDGFYLDLDHKPITDDESVIVVSKEKKKKIKKPYIPGKQYVKASNILKELTKQVK
ncbi:MAG: hypothetical protein BWY04_01374 [candidate division CPR1 bacterium ADurb.Bin160]|uniref:Uncharacterized protein n=1 Tax=candidate division CPR1 bacterium ADurb.Bin160 TaxID=1852826 RepID=A0A1V5ZJR7_9BACT|nr:MAG: hypothetical protein BWY04_01374 [candidate division CPR1 bacterium ADurb.Bin160]